MELKRYTALALGTLSLSSPLYAGNKESEKPNVIFIVTDDQLYKTMGCYGGNALTPYIDSLADNGIRFTNANVTCTVCSPSRYSILTGRHPAQCKEKIFLKRMPEGKPLRIENFISLEKNKLNIGGVLQANGYTTGFVGKSHIAEHFKKKDWEKYGLQPYRKKDNPRDPEVNAKMKHNHRILADRMKQYGFDYVEAYYRANLLELLNKSLNVHNVEWTAKAAADFIEQNKDKPFFLYYSTTAHHGPDPDIIKENKFPFSLDADIRMTSAGFFPEGFDGVMQDRQEIKKRVLKAGYPLKTAAYTWLDESIGVILRKLREHQIEDNTIIVYMSDHGFERYQKATAFEGGVKIPMIIQWKKGIPKAAVSEEMVQSLDLAPTVFEACGVKPPKEMALAGKSIMPILKGENTKIHDFIYAEIGYARTIKTKKWKYIAVRYPEDVKKKIARGEKFESFKGKAGMLGKPYLVANKHLGYCSSSRNKHYFEQDQLYDLEKDPKETTNLYGKYPKVEKELKKKLSYMLKQHNRPFGEFNK